jgi:hypothetical protein
MGTAVAVGVGVLGAGVAVVVGVAVAVGVRVPVAVAVAVVGMTRGRVLMATLGVMKSLLALTHPSVAPGVWTDAPTPAAI